MNRKFETRSEESVNLIMESLRMVGVECRRVKEGEKGGIFYRDANGERKKFTDNIFVKRSMKYDQSSEKELIKEISMKTDDGTLHIRANPETQSVAIMLDPENGNEEIDIAHIRNFDTIEAGDKSAALKNIRVEVCEYEAGECMLHEHLIYPEEADETPNDDD